MHHMLYYFLLAVALSDMLTSAQVENRKTKPVIRNSHLFTISHAKLFLKGDRDATGNQLNPLTS